MGYGDQLMATGMARGAWARGVRIAFGDGREIAWDHYSEPIFRGNPNIAPPGAERDGTRLEWNSFRRGHRTYNRQSNVRWIWNDNFRAQPGEMFLTKEEVHAAAGAEGAVILEPMVPSFKSVAVNKDWGIGRWTELARRLFAAGIPVRQPIYDSARALDRAPQIRTPSFRHAAAAISRAALYVGPEGGLHHAAAAFGKRAVVIFGGFVPPMVTGYDFHLNLTGGESSFCGSFLRCEHCALALGRISVDEVFEKVVEQYNAWKATGGEHDGRFA